MENDRPIVYLFVGIVALISRPGTGGSVRVRNLHVIQGHRVIRVYRLHVMAHLLGGVQVFLDYGEDHELSHQMHSLSLHDQAHKISRSRITFCAPGSNGFQFITPSNALLLAVTYTIPRSWAPRVFTIRLSSKSIDHFLEVNITEGQI